MEPTCACVLIRRGAPDRLTSAFDLTGGVREETVFHHSMSKAFFFRTGAALFFLLAGAGQLWAQSEDQKLESFFKTYLDEMFRLRPMAATELGDHRFDSQLEDLTPAARAKWRELAEQTLAALPQQVDYAKLTRPAQIDFEILKHSLTTELWLNENFHPFETDPRIYNGEYVYSPKHDRVLSVRVCASCGDVNVGGKVSARTDDSKHRNQRMITAPGARRK